MRKEIDQAIQTLERFLTSDAVGPDAMSLSGLHGYLTGLHTGPELVMPSEWLDAIWGSEEPTYDHLDQAQAVLSALMLLYNDVGTKLGKGPGRLKPIFRRGSQGEVLAADWARGFLLAVGPQLEDATELLADGDVVTMLGPLMAVALSGPAEDRQGVGTGPEGSEEPLSGDDLELAIGLLPDCVEMLYAALRGTDADDPKPDFGKVGRNHPCPCGSGRKFKKCCGAGRTV